MTTFLKILLSTNEIQQNSKFTIKMWFFKIVKITIQVSQILDIMYSHYNPHCTKIFCKIFIQSLKALLKIEGLKEILFPNWEICVYLLLWKLYFYQYLNYGKTFVLGRATMLTKSYPQATYTDLNWLRRGHLLLTGINKTGKIAANLSPSWIQWKNQRRKSSSYYYSSSPTQMTG